MVFILLKLLLFAFYVRITVASHLSNLHEALNYNSSILTSKSNEPLQKRDSGSRFTYFATGLGACGRVNKPSDFIVAINTYQWNGGSHCFESITMSYGGKTTVAQIVDLCEACPYNGLDLSSGLFGFLAPLSLGVISGSWSFGTSEPSPKMTPTPTHSQTHSATPSPLAKPKVLASSRSSSSHLSSSTSSTLLKVTSILAPMANHTSPTVSLITNSQSADLVIETNVNNELLGNSTDRESNLMKLNSAIINYGLLIKNAKPTQSVKT